MRDSSSDVVVQVSGANNYEITLGYGVRDNLAEVLPAKARKVLLIHQPSLRVEAEKLRESLLAEREVLLAEIPDAEDAKRVEVAAFCWQILGQADFTRSDAVIGFGGGAATDLAGFVAATWLRGVSLIQVPTTVLGMVDAAVGGKTGINTAEGKNLVGAFWAPDAVLCDLDYLQTLPKNEIVTGFAEVIKAGFIWSPEILEIVERDPELAVTPGSPELLRCMQLAIEMKARVVSEDFREADLREILNYGHTLGHAIEHAERYRMRHGAAISIGMVFAAELGALAGRLDESVVLRTRSILESLGLPISYRAGAWPQLLSTMQRDKKARAGMLRFVVLDDLARPQILQAPDEALLYAAYQSVSE